MTLLELEMRLCNFESLSICFVVLVTLDLFDCVVCDNVINAVTGHVGAGNYTYFMLKYEVTRVPI